MFFIRTDTTLIAFRYQKGCVRIIFTRCLSRYGLCQLISKTQFGNKVNEIDVNVLNHIALNLSTSYYYSTHDILKTGDYLSMLGLKLNHVSKGGQEMPLNVSVSTCNEVY